MGFFEALKAKKRMASTAIFHIGSAGVEAGLLGADDNEHKLIYSDRATFPFRKNIEPEHYERTMLAALLDVGMQVQTEGFKRIRESTRAAAPPNTVYCFYSSPWYVSQLRAVTLAREKDFKFEKDQFTSAVNTERDRFSSQLSELKDGPLRGGVSVVDMVPLETTLNGYAVDSPIGRIAQSARMSFFASAVSATTRKQVEDVIHRIFPDSAIISHTSVLPQLSVVCSAPDRVERFLMLEIGGEVTELSLVRGNVIEDTVSFPIGTSQVARLSPGNDSIAQGRAVLSAKEKSGGRTEELGQARIAALTEWQEQFLEACKELGEGSALPRHAVVLVEDEWEFDFKKALARISAPELTFSPEPFIVLEHGEVNGLETYADTSLVPSERLLVDTYFVNSQLVNKEDGVRHEVA